MMLAAYFTQGGMPVTGLTPTLRVRDMSTGSLVVDTAMTEIGDGFYKYDFTGYDQNKDYAMRADGGTSLGVNERYLYGGNEMYPVDAGEGGEIQ